MVSYYFYHIYLRTGNKKGLKELEGRRSFETILGRQRRANLYVMNKDLTPLFSFIS
jgi:hypothetical protein